MEKSKRLLLSPQFKKILVVTIILVTLGVFGYYLVTHREIVETLLHLPAYLLVLLTIGYVGAIMANAFVLHTSLKLLGKKAHFADNIALTSYSSIINFFGPLQSGPGARAVYLKAKYGVRLRDFFGVTLLFYAFFAFINGIIVALAIVIQFQSWTAFSIVLLGIIVVTMLGIAAYRRVERVRHVLHSFKFHDINTWLVGLGAALLIAATTFTYFFELMYVSPGVSIWQVVIYTAAANLALFVSLTPGAIGFRETFLVLSTKLHGIDSATIVAANIIDRAFYIVFLLVVFLILISLGRRMGFSFQKPQDSQK